MAFLNSSDKNACQSLLQEIFDTFAEKIVIYKTPIRTVVATENYNFAYTDAQNEETTYEPQRGEFLATIEYINSLTASKRSYPIENANLSIDKVYARISVKSDAKEWLDDVQEIDIDGAKFKLISGGQPRGFTSRAWFDYLLEKLK